MWSSERLGGSRELPPHVSELSPRDREPVLRPQPQELPHVSTHVENRDHLMSTLMDVVHAAARRFDARPIYRASLDAQRELGLTPNQGIAMVGSCTDRIDLNGSARTQPVACVRPKGLRHYIIVRADLPVGLQIAQTVHAAGESATPKPEPGTHAVALHARDEAHLREIAARLTAAGIGHHLVEECDDDDDYPGQLMSIGLHPTTERERVAKVLSSLPLAR